MATVTFTDGVNIDFVTAFSSPVESPSMDQLIAAVAAMTSLTLPDSGVITLTAPLLNAATTAGMIALGAPHDDSSVPPVITMTDVQVDFDWTITNGAMSSGTPFSSVQGFIAPDPTQGVGLSTGHFTAHDTPTNYFGGTDRATLFAGSVGWGFTFGNWVSGAMPTHTRRFGVTNYAVIITYTLPASVTRVLPNTGTILGGTDVTVTGTGFTAATGVTFGGTAATAVVIVNDTTITCTTAAHASGRVDVEVLSVATGTGLYTYVIPGITVPPPPYRAPVTQRG